MSYKRNLNRKSYRGNVKAKGGQALAKAAKSATTTDYSGAGYWSGGHSTYTAPKKLPPISDEVTNYGATKFRSPHYKGEFVGYQGEPIPAGVLDIDGTLQGFGQGADAKLLKWVERLQKDNPDMVWLIVTARDHGSFGYDSSFNWVMRHFPYPFAAMVARPKTDPRYASEFKREVAQGWEDMGLYQIIAAADDNEWVIKMWKQWAIEHFEEPKDFELFEASYGTYADWRYDLPTKVGRPSSYTGTYSDPHKDEVWVRGVQKADGTWTTAHWAKKDSPEAKAQEASDKTKYGSGSAAQTSGWGKDPVDGVWKNYRDHGEQPRPGDDIASDQAWAVYFTRREDAGAYLAPDFTTDDEDAELNFFIDRAEMELWVAHESPELTPDDLKNMTNKELWEAVALDYEDELHMAIDKKFPGLFKAEDLRFLEASELEELFKINDQDEAEDYMAAILRFITNFGEGSEDKPVYLDADESMTREDLESEVYANSAYSNEEITAMDTDQLRHVIAHNNMLNHLDEEGIEMPPTGELDVAEILRQMGEQPASAEDEVLAEAEKIIDHYDQLALGYDDGGDEAQAGVA